MASDFFTIIAGIFCTESTVVVSALTNSTKRKFDWLQAVSA